MSEDKSSAPLVSVVVPTYNNEPFIRETMTSILNQTYAYLEVIVSDHGSTDGTWAALQPFVLDPRVSLIQIPHSDRVADNWTSATKAASGDYLKLVCGDDVLKPDCKSNGKYLHWCAPREPSWQHRVAM